MAVIKSYVADLRVSFIGETDSGMEVHDCVILPLTLINPDPANFAIMQQAALKLVSERLAVHEANRQAGIEKEKNKIVPTDEELFAAVYDEAAMAVPSDKAEAFKAFVEARLGAV